MLKRLWIRSNRVLIAQSYPDHEIAGDAWHIEIHNMTFKYTQQKFTLAGVFLGQKCYQPLWRDHKRTPCDFGDF